MLSPPAVTVAGATRPRTMSDLGLFEDTLMTTRCVCAVHVCVHIDVCVWRVHTVGPAEGIFTELCQDTLMSRRSPVCARWCHRPSACDAPGPCDAPDVCDAPDPCDAPERRRAEELAWLRTLVQTAIPMEDLCRLVAHRGFHSTHDRTDRSVL